MKTHPVTGVAALSVAVILFAISLPVLIARPCLLTPDNACVYSIPSPSYEMELSMSLFGVAFAIGGIALLVTSRLEQHEVKNKSPDV